MSLMKLYYLDIQCFRRLKNLIEQSDKQVFSWMSDKGWIPPPETNPHSQNPPSSQSVKLRDKRFFTTNLGSKCSPRMSIFYVNTDLKKTNQNLAGSCLESQTCQSVLKTSCTRCVSLQLFVSHLVSRTKYHNAQIAVVAARAVRLLSQCEALKRATNVTTIKMWFRVAEKLLWRSVTDRDALAEAR